MSHHWPQSMIEATGASKGPNQQQPFMSETWQSIAPYIHTHTYISLHITNNMYIQVDHLYD